MKRILALLLAVILAMSFMGCGTENPEGTTPAATTPAPTAAQPTPEPTAEPDATRIFTDSAGRAVEVPANIKSIAVSGPLAQITLFALAPDMLVGIASEWDETAAQFFDEKYYSLPVLGQLYGGKGELNLETLLASGAEVVIDVGEAKGGIVEDMDALSEQTGIPFVHIAASLETMGDAYRMLGDLLGLPEQAEALAAYCERVYEDTRAIAESVEKANLLYITGAEGHNVIAKGSYHAEVIDLLCNNLAEVAEPSSKGTGNEADMEQILAWNPDVILFSPGSAYASVGSDDAWQSVNAVKNGTYYEVPFGPYNWLGFPPSVQRYLGILWMAKLLYPEAASYDLYEEIANYFALFYHCELTQEQYEALVANSIGQEAS